jgi:copper homeostasis protein
LEDVIACGFDTILTSGGAENALAGAEVLRRLVKNAKSRVIIMPGGGIRSSHIEALKEVSWAQWYHSSAMVDGKEINAEEIRLLKKLLLPQSRLAMTGANSIEIEIKNPRF